jgi:selenocysteine lyase/cysteine desulfurase
MDWGRQRCAIVTVATDGVEPTELKLRLRARGVNTSTTAHEDAVIDLDAKGIRSVLRFSPHYYNTEEELDNAVTALQEELHR